MTIEALRSVLKQLETQYQHILTTPAEKPVIQFTNAIELCGAMQLARQLIQQEEIVAAAPPGSTGPSL